MKKRRELNALVLKSSSRSSKTKNGNHELLRNDSYSSEGEEFVLPEKDITPTKKPKSNFCLMCLLTFSIVMLLCCFGIIGSLLWMFLQLKNEVQDMRSQINTVENTSLQKMQDLVMREIQINLRLNNLESSKEQAEQGSMKTVADIILLQNQVALLQNVTNTRSSSALMGELKELSKTIADTGNLLSTLEEDVGELKKFKLENMEAFSNLQDRVQSLQLATSKTSSGDVTIKDVESLIQNVTNTILGNKEKVLFGRFDKLEETSKNLKNLTGLMNSRVSFLEVRMSENETFFKAIVKKILRPTEEQIKDSITNITVEVRSLKPQLDSTLAITKVLNTSFAKLTYRITSLETKLVLLAEQKEENERPRSTTKSTGRSTFENSERQTTTTTDIDKDGIGAPSEIAPTSTLELNTSAEKILDFYKSRDTDVTPTSSEYNTSN